MKSHIALEKVSQSGAYLSWRSLQLRTLEVTEVSEVVALYLNRGHISASCVQHGHQSRIGAWVLGLQEGTNAIVEAHCESLIADMAMVCELCYSDRSSSLILDELYAQERALKCLECCHLGHVVIVVIVCVDIAFSVFDECEYEVVNGGG